MRRIVLIDADETPDYIKYSELRVKETYLLQQFEYMTEQEVNKILTIGPGDAVMLVGASPFKFLKQYYHFGIRNENYFDCSKLYRLSLEGGAFALCIADFPTTEVVDEFLNPRYTTVRNFPNYKGSVIKTLREAVNYIQWLDSLPQNTPIGFDYEGSGMALDEVFELSGFSLSLENEAKFISLTDIRRELGGAIEGASTEEYKYLLQLLGDFLTRRQSFIWAYNIQYEFQVSHRMLGVDLYNLCDASVFNVLRGNHLKRYSLKWTANSILYTNVWDSDFDRLSDWLYSMYFETVGKTKKDKVLQLRVTPTTYKDTAEWKLICENYPKYISEFEQLISEYWAMPFMNIPSDILGYYCNLDSNYTLRIFLEEKDNYSEVARETFLDNIRLGARLHSLGMYKDEEFRLNYKDECEKMMAWSITYCAMARCTIKMKKHGKGMAKIAHYNPICQKLLNKGKFFNGAEMEILKYLLLDNLDTLDTTTTGLNEGKLLMEYGPDFATDFVELVKDAMVEVKMKTKIDASIGRKRKILGILSEKLKDLLELEKITIDNKHVKLEKYIYYERSMKELTKVCKKYFNNDIVNMPSSNTMIKCFGQEFTMLDYSTFVSNNFFKCKSPQENDEIAKELATLFKKETAWLAAISEATQQLNGADGFYKKLNIHKPEDGFSHFLGEWEDYCKGNTRKFTYPEKVFTLALDYWRNVTLDKPKSIWTNFDGFAAQAQFFKSAKDEYQLYGTVFDEKELSSNLFFMRKLVINYLLYKKYAKVLSTYIDGLFLKTDLQVIEDPKTGLPIRKALPGEPGAVTKMFARYEINTKSSKRWSSGYHTIVSHSDIKSTINTPPGCLLTYFDISSAEVKSAGFASGDPDLIDKFVNNIDIYVYTGKLYLPDGPWETDPAFRGMWRKRFKTIFLGILYGLGKRSLAERLNCTEEEAETIIEATYQAFPKLREYVKSQQEYPFKNDGYVNTFFGDRLKVDEWKYYLAASSEREKKSLQSRIERLGVNLPIQGGTSSAMAAGFFNDMRVANNEGWNLRPIIVVHDSNTNYIPISKLFEIKKFYDEHFTEFCYKSTGIKLLFDLLCGTDYETACEMKQLDDNNIQFSGNAHSLLKIIDKVMECGDINVSCSMAREEIIPAYVTHPIDRFIKEKGTSIVLDKSWYSIILTKLN